jgi:putative ABC transport system permease protein
LIGYRLWRSWFAGDEGIVGRQVQLTGRPATIIGVLGPGFYFRNRNTDLWAPLGLNPANNYRKTAGRYLMSVARLKPGASQQRAQAQMTAIAQRLEAAYPEFDTNWGVTLEPLRDSLVREVKTSMQVLLGAVGLLLMVACANVANLLWRARRRGAAKPWRQDVGRWRVVRQLTAGERLSRVRPVALGSDGR